MAEKTENTPQEKLEWETPEVIGLEHDSTKGGGFGGNEVTTTKPGS